MVIVAWAEELAFCEAFDESDWGVVGSDCARLEMVRSSAVVSARHCLVLTFIRDRNLRRIERGSKLLTVAILKPPVGEAEPSVEVALGVLESAL
jgi:hypothetical protein